MRETIATRERVVEVVVVNANAPHTPGRSITRVTDDGANDVMESAGMIAVNDGTMRCMTMPRSHPRSDRE